VMIGRFQVGSVFWSCHFCFISGVASLCSHNFCWIHQWNSFPPICVRDVSVPSEVCCCGRCGHGSSRFTSPEGFGCGLKAEVPLVTIVVVSSRWVHVFIPGFRFQICFRGGGGEFLATVSVRGSGGGIVVGVASVLFFSLVGWWWFAMLWWWWCLFLVTGGRHYMIRVVFSTSNRRRCPCFVVGFRHPLEMCLCGRLFSW